MCSWEIGDLRGAPSIRAGVGTATVKVDDPYKTKTSAVKALMVVGFCCKLCKLVVLGRLERMYCVGFAYVCVGVVRWVGG